MNEVESVAHDDEGQLIGELGLFQEVLHAFWAVTVGLSTYSLDLRKRIDVVIKN